MHRDDIDGHRKLLRSARDAKPFYLAPLAFPHPSRSYIILTINCHSPSGQPSIMSASGSALSNVDATRKAPARSRHNSATTVPTQSQDAKPSKQPSLEGPQLKSTPPAHYTVFIRLPFKRGDFQDPTPVEWDSTKDKALWKLISKASNTKELDWEDISLKFNVSLPFLLQQAAWLYERHFESMRAQMKKLGAASGTSSPAPQQADGGVSVGGGATGGGVSMQRTGSRG